jgi:asparagine synthase (glutamine-hydrolysing)
MKIRGWTGKYLHKKAATKWLPAQVVNRKKKGFANPVDQWLRGGMQHFVYDYLLSPDAAVNEFFNQAYIREILEEHRTGRRDHLRHIYLLISFELWHRQFIRGTRAGHAAQSVEATATSGF